MGWYRKRSREDFMESVDGWHEHLTDEITLHRYHMRIPVEMIQDLPATIQGRGSLLKTSPVDFLDHEMPGIASALYEWFEPESAGELIGELLSSYRGQPYEAAQESEEDS